MCRPCRRIRKAHIFRRRAEARELHIPSLVQQPRLQPQSIADQVQLLFRVRGRHSGAAGEAVLQSVRTIRDLAGRR